MLIFISYFLLDKISIQENYGISSELSWNFLETVTVFFFSNGKRKQRKKGSSAINDISLNFLLPFVWKPKQMVEIMLLVSVSVMGKSYLMPQKVPFLPEI